MELHHPAGLKAGSCAGIPFVLEIWPAGHNSPIHNHGNAYGIVRVLHGDITGAPLDNGVMRSGIA